MFTPLPYGKKVGHNLPSRHTYADEVQDEIIPKTKSIVSPVLVQTRLHAYLDMQRRLRTDRLD